VMYNRRILYAHQNSVCAPVVRVFPPVLCLFPSCEAARDAPDRRDDEARPVPQIEALHGECTGFFARSNE
jgi:hypothetical protein